VPPTDYTPIPIDDTQVTTSSDYYEALWLENKRFAQSTRAVSFPFCLFDWMTPIDDIRL
jgi:hypothetical protein